MTANSFGRKVAGQVAGNFSRRLGVHPQPEFLDITIRDGSYAIATDINLSLLAAPPLA